MPSFIETTKRTEERVLSVTATSSTCWPIPATLGVVYAVFTGSAAVTVTRQVAVLEPDFAVMTALPG